MLNKDRIGALCMLAFAIAYGVLTTHIHLLPFQSNSAFTARTMPTVLAVIGIALSLIILIRPTDRSMPNVTGFQWKRGVAICAVMLLYGFTVRPVGFLIATTLFLIAGFMILGERRVKVILGASFPIVLAFWLLMTQLLDVYIPALPEFLGF